jgi:hypothetical protein
MFGQMPPIQMSPVWSEQFPQPSTPPKPRGGMFGGGGSWQNAILAAVAGLMARHNPMAAQMIMGQLKSKLDAKREDQQYQRQRQDKRDDFTFEQDYRAQHPAPINNDTANDYEYIKGILGEDAAKQFLQTRVNPIVNTPMGPVPYSSVMGQQGQPAPPGITFKPLDQNGGPVLQAPGGFPGY